MPETRQGALPADNSAEALLALVIWDSEVHPLWFGELQERGQENADETENREETRLAMLADRVSELHQEQQKVKIAVER
jgi:hypothetical protein